METVRRMAMFSRPSAAVEWIATAALGMMATVSPIRAAETVTYYYTSPQGTVLATTDAAGNVLSTADYRPFGSQVLGVPEEGPGFTGHVNDLDSGLTYMQQRYYDPLIGRFLSVDPAAEETDPNRYWYANNNPYKFMDPDGLLARGSGFTDTQWEAFNNAQQSAATNLERASAKIASALASGDGLKSVERSFERTFGKGSATPENMAKVASDMGSMAAALRDTGSSAIVANGVTTAELDKAYGGDNSSTLAAVPSDGPVQVLVNTSHPSFGSDSKLTWAAGHEMAHAVLGYKDVPINGWKGYKYGRPEERRSFRNYPSPQSLSNPDHLMDYSQ